MNFQLNIVHVFRNYNSQTVLMTAVQNGSENVVALLLALGAKTELLTKDTGLTAIDLAHQLKLLQLTILLSVSSGNCIV